jgi:hypothetical protein
MILTVEFFLGLIAAFVIGYAIAKALEKIFHWNLKETDLNDLDLNKHKKV